MRIEGGTSVKHSLMIFVVLVFLLAFSALILAHEAAEEEFVLDKDKHYYVQVTDCAVHIPTNEPYRYLQGGGTDGKYAYYAMTEGKDYALIYKYDLKNWQCVAISEPLKLGHANDITYDSNRHRLIVAYVELNRVCYVDPDSLTDLGFDRTLFSVHRLEHLPKSNQLLIGSGYYLSFFQDGNYRRSDSYFECQGNRYVTQGLACDENYVYDVRWDVDQYEASLANDTIVCDFIVVHDVQGNYIGDIPVYGLSGEPENIICLGGNQFAIGCNGSDSVYLAELREIQ